MRIKLGLIILMLGAITACTNEPTDKAENGNQQSTQPIHYETEQEKRERLGTFAENGKKKYPQSEQKKGTEANFKNGYSDSFTNEETEMITRALKNKTQIVQAQVAATEDRIIVGVMLKDDVRQDIGNEIKQEVKKLVPNSNKEIIVYTDEEHWNKMKNLDNRLKPKYNGEKLEEILTP